MPDPFRILHLEDNPSDAELIRLSLAKIEPGAKITLARNRSESFAAFGDGTFDLILADHHLPDFDGITALQFALKTMPDTPVIILTGTTGENLEAQCLREGAADFLLKDELGRLGGIMRRALREGRERRGRGRAEEAQRALESNYHRLFQSNPTPILVYDRNTLAILTVNEAAMRHYGHTREQFLSKNLADIALSQEVPAFVAKLSGLADGTGNCGIWRHRKKDEKVCEMDITSHAMIHEGKPAWLSLAVDVTERLNLEAQLLHSQKMDSVGQLAGGIAHDFNNLLTVINGHTGLLLAMDNLPPKFADSIREIANAARRAAELTRQLLTFSRKNVLQPQIVDLNEVVGNVGKMLRRILGEDITLETNFSPNLPSVKADLGMMEQVLLNLAVNSRDAMPRGGRLRIATTAPMVDAAQIKAHPEASPGRHVCLEFADTGCGIPLENLSRIFEPFYTTKELDRGTGLGLATVYGIIRQHQGWIQVNSMVNEGTRFQIFLPASPEASGPVNMPAGEPRVIGGTETVLAVEDEAPLLRLIKHILESFGYKVLECSTGKAALEIWGEHRKKIDLLLTDVVLPDGMAGPELAEMLMTSKPGLKVVYTSGYNAETLARNIPVTPGAKFIQKPFHARKLAETVFDCFNDNGGQSKNSG